MASIACLVQGTQQACHKDGAGWPRRQLCVTPVNRSQSLWMAHWVGGTMQAFKGFIENPMKQMLV